MRLLAYFILIIILAGCSKAPTTRTLEVTRASLGSTTLNGGMLVKMTDLTTGTFSTAELTTTPYDVLIPDGNWKLEVVGFVGPAQWGGVRKCGSTTITLDSLATEINITVSTECSAEPYLALIALKSSLWDLATFNNAKWAP